MASNEQKSHLSHFGHAKQNPGLTELTVAQHILQVPLLTHHHSLWFQDVLEKPWVVLVAWWHCPLDTGNGEIGFFQYACIHLKIQGFRHLIERLMVLLHYPYIPKIFHGLTKMYKTNVHDSSLISVHFLNNNTSWIESLQSIVICVEYTRIFPFDMSTTAK